MIALDKEETLDNFTSSLQNVAAMHGCHHIVKQFSPCQTSSWLFSETSCTVRKQHQHVKCVFLGFFDAVCVLYWSHLDTHLIRLIRN